MKYDNYRQRYSPLNIPIRIVCAWAVFSLAHDLVAGVPLVGVVIQAAHSELLSLHDSLHQRQLPGVIRLVVILRSVLAPPGDKHEEIHQNCHREVTPTTQLPRHALHDAK